MTRFLPVLAIQAPARAVVSDGDYERFEQELAVHLSDFGPNFGAEAGQPVDEAAAQARGDQEEKCQLHAVFQ